MCRNHSAWISETEEEKEWTSVTLITPGSVLSKYSHLQRTGWWNINLNDISPWCQVESNINLKLSD